MGVYVWSQAGPGSALSESCRRVSVRSTSEPQAQLILNQGTQLPAAVRPGAHNGKFSCELVSELPLNKMHSGGSQLSLAELLLKPTFLIAKVCGKVWIPIIIIF